MARPALRAGARALGTRSSENADGSQALDAGDADHVTQAGGAEQCAHAHAAEEGAVGQSTALIGVLDGGFADVTSPTALSAIDVVDAETVVLFCSEPPDAVTVAIPEL